VCVWKKQKVTHLILQATTTSDEAYALLMLENNWDKWLSPDAIDSRKYTNNTKGNKMFEGWLPQGLHHYNELYELVKDQ
jgi:hypothetical protein